MRITPDKEEVTGTIFGLTRMWFWLGMICLTMFVVGTGVMMTKPYWLGLERKAFVASHQYVEARRTELNTLYTQVTQIDSRIALTENEAGKRALRLQKDALVTRIRTAAMEIPRDSLSPEIARLVFAQ